LPCGSRLQAQLRAARGDTRTNEVNEECELSANQVLYLDPMPFTFDEEVLIGGKRLDALVEAFDEMFGIAGGGLASDLSTDLAA
jgi:hypothetical protein